jgi:pSer/pThr/pTyr-binding forkhead associated (FHA) protein
MPADHECLISRTDGELVRRLRLDPTRAYSIGRSNRCDIVLAPTSVSRRHALLVPFSGRWLLFDTGSRRGLWSPAGAVRQADLLSAGWVCVGPLSLTVVRADAPGAPPPGAWDGGDPSAATLTDADEEDSPSAGELLAVERPTGVADRRALERLVDLSSIRHATVGSDLDCDIRLAEADGVAPLHAVLFREPKAWVVVDGGAGIRCEGRSWIRKRLDATTAVELGGIALRVLRPERLLRTQDVASGAAILSERRE